MGRGGSGFGWWLLWVWGGSRWVSWKVRDGKRGEGVGVGVKVGSFCR